MTRYDDYPKKRILRSVTSQKKAKNYAFFDSVFDDFKKEFDNLYTHYHKEECEETKKIIQGNIHEKAHKQAINYAKNETLKYWGIRSLCYKSSDEYYNTIMMNEYNRLYWIMYFEEFRKYEIQIIIRASMSALFDICNNKLSLHSNKLCRICEKDFTSHCCIFENAYKKSYYQELNRADILYNKGTCNYDQYKDLCYCAHNVACKDAFSAYNKHFQV